MLKKVGLRTIKTAIGAALALYISTLLELDFAMFSAIILIMCIERTKRKTLLTIGEKFFASLLGLILSGLSFELLGYQPIVVALFILLFIPILVRFRIQAGFVTSMVVVLHVYTFKNFSLQVVQNELSIIAIGMGLALLINSVMPSFKEDIDFFQRRIERKLATIWKRFSLSLRDKDTEWDGGEIFALEDILNQAKELALKEVENRFLREEFEVRANLYYLVFEMENYFKIKRELFA